MKKLMIAMMLLSLNGFTQEEARHIRYKKGKRLDFESLLVEGENKKAELSVVTGNLGEKDLGLLKLKQDFNDLNSDDYGEEVK